MYSRPKMTSEKTPRMQRALLSIANTAQLLASPSNTHQLLIDGQPTTSQPSECAAPVASSLSQLVSVLSKERDDANTAASEQRNRADELERRLHEMQILRESQLVDADLHSSKLIEACERAEKAEARANGMELLMKQQQKSISAERNAKARLTDELAEIRVQIQKKSNQLQAAECLLADEQRVVILVRGEKAALDNELKAANHELSQLKRELKQLKTNESKVCSSLQAEMQRAEMVLQQERDVRAKLEREIAELLEDQMRASDLHQASSNRSAILNTPPLSPSPPPSQQQSLMESAQHELETTKTEMENVLRRLYAAEATLSTSEAQCAQAKREADQARDKLTRISADEQQRWSMRLQHVVDTHKIECQSYSQTIESLRSELADARAIKASEEINALQQLPLKPVSQGLAVQLQAALKESLDAARKLHRENNQLKSRLKIAESARLDAQERSAALVTEVSEVRSDKQKIEDETAFLKGRVANLEAEIKKERFAGRQLSRFAKRLALENGQQATTLKHELAQTRAKFEDFFQACSDVNKVTAALHAPQEG